MQEFPIHPTAVALARASGISRSDAANILTDMLMNLPAGMLLGGYTLDTAVLGLWIAMKADADDQGWTDSDIIERIAEAIEAGWEGMI